MQLPTKKLKSGFELPVYGLGTWQMGGRAERNPENNDEADIQAIKAAIDLGVTYLDTAESYANGYSEVLLGKAIKDYDREKLLIVSKVSLEHLGFDDLINSCRNSLKNLDTPYLDLYLVHMYNPQIPLKESIRAMEVLLEEGLIKNIGVSNFNVERMEEAQSLTKHKIVANQIHLNLKYRESERKGVLKYCQENDVMFIAWRPTQKGILLENVPSILQDMADKYQKTPAQVAINWLISQDHVTTLAKTTNIEHLKENLGAIGWEMEAGDIEKLRTEFPGQEDISDAVPID